MFDKHPVIGLVLAGGSSSRMGRDKAELIYHDRPQATFIYDLLSYFCNKIFISVNKEKVNITYPHMADKYEFSGPLNGILSALDAFPGFAIFSIPCDSPGIDKHLIEKILSARDTSAVATCFIHKNQLEPLFTIWEPASRILLHEHVKNGNHSPLSFLKKNKVYTLRLPDPLTNINTIDELREYKLGIKD